MSKKKLMCIVILASLLLAAFVIGFTIRHIRRNIVILDDCSIYLGMSKKQFENRWRGGKENPAMAGHDNELSYSDVLLLDEKMNATFEFRGNKLNRVWIYIAVPTEREALAIRDKFISNTYSKYSAIASFLKERQTDPGGVCLSSWLTPVYLFDITYLEASDSWQFGIEIIQNDSPAP